MALLKGQLTSINMGGGIRMDMNAIEMKNVNMFVLNGNRGLVTIAMQRGGKKLVERIQEEIKRQDLVDSGDLLNSIAITDMQNDLRAGVSISVGSNVSYAKAVNDGTPPIIMPKRGRTLFIGGTRIIEGKPLTRTEDKYGLGRHISVSGQKAHKFFEKALRDSEISDFTRR